MGTARVNLGAALPDESPVFRAFSEDGHRRKNKVRARAFYRPKDHEDGISVGLTPRHAVADLSVNFGYCRLSVGAVHSLPNNLQVCPDLGKEGHALILNVPCIDGTDEEREMAELIAGQLAKLAEVVTYECYRPNGVDAAHA